MDTQIKRRCGTMAVTQVIPLIHIQVTHQIPIAHIVLALQKLQCSTSNNTHNGQTITAKQKSVGPQG